jgi:hypothetical protein
LQVAIEVVPTTTGLHLLVDITGIKMLGESEWKIRKHGAEYRRQWRKVHLGIDATTLKIRAMEVTDNSIGDAPVLPELLDQIPVEQQIASVSADGAYDTKACHEALALRNAHAIIPTRKMLNLGRRIALERRRVMRFCAQRADSGARYGKGGVAITDVVSSKRKCAASSSLASASKRVTSTAKSLNYRYVLRC